MQIYKVAVFLLTFSSCDNNEYLLEILLAKDKLECRDRFMGMPFSKKDSTWNEKYYYDFDLSSISKIYKGKSIKIPNRYMSKCKMRYSLEEELQFNYFSAYNILRIHFDEKSYSADKIFITLTLAKYRNLDSLLQHLDDRMRLTKVLQHASDSEIDFEHYSYSVQAPYLFFTWAIFVHNECEVFAKNFRIDVKNKEFIIIEREWYSDNLDLLYEVVNFPKTLDGLKGY